MADLTRLMARDGHEFNAWLSAPQGAARGAFAALRFRNFRLLWASAALSSMAQWVQQAAMGWVVYELTGSSALLGIILGWLTTFVIKGVAENLVAQSLSFRIVPAAALNGLIDSTQVDIGQPPRRFASFSAARSEVAMSRVYAGVHYFPAVMDGLTQGQCIGRRMVALRTRRAR